MHPFSGLVTTRQLKLQYNQTETNPTGQRKASAFPKKGKEFEKKVKEEWAQNEAVMVK